MMAGIAQETFLEIDNVVFKSKAQIENVYPVANEDNSFALFFQQDDWIYGYLFNKASQQLGKLSFPLINEELDAIVGHTKSGNSYGILLKEKNKKIFEKIYFDFDRQKSFKNTIDIKFEKERLIAIHSRKEIIYFISVKKGDSKLYLRSLYHKKTTEDDVVNWDFNSKSFIGHYGASMTLDELIIQDYNTNFPLASKVDANTLNDFFVAGRKNKLYHNGKDIILSFDNSRKSTYLIQIDLENLNFNYKEIEKTKKISSFYSPDSNSFLFDNHLHQVKASKKELYYTITDLTSNEKIKIFNFDNKEDINFKNGPYIHRAFIFNSLTTKKKETYSEIEKTKKFLKLVNSGITIVPYKIGENINIRIGSSYYNYLNQQATKPISLNTLYMNVLLDSSFNEVKERILENNDSDKLLNYRYQLNKPNAVTKFKIGDQYILGYFDKKLKRYILTKFK